LYELKRLVVREKRRVPQWLVEIFRVQIRIIRQNPLPRFADGEQSQKTRDREPQTPDTGFAGADGRFDRDAWK
jgi:hypothetical protein